jgi:Uma2 family endonuclease
MIMNPTDTTSGVLPPPAWGTAPAIGAGVPDWDPSLLPEPPDLDQLITDDGAPVERIFIEKLHRLLTEPLYSSWSGPGEGCHFLALANVGWFYASGQPPLVPDCLLSLNVRPGGDLRTKEGRSYFQWLIGKPPEVVIEFVSDRRGGEEDFKMKVYAEQGVLYYVIYDPDNLLGGGVLRAYGLRDGEYQPIDPRWLPKVKLGLVQWEGTFEGEQQTWLRWCDREGKVILTGAERAEEERRRADDERRRADDERRRADEVTEKLNRLAAQLQALGIKPEA